MVRATLAFAFLIGIVLLQIFLSRTERKWPGLILPIISMFMLVPPIITSGQVITELFRYHVIIFFPILHIWYSIKPFSDQSPQLLNIRQIKRTKLLITDGFTCLI